MSPTLTAIRGETCFCRGRTVGRLIEWLLPIGVLLWFMRRGAGLGVRVLQNTESFRIKTFSVLRARDPHAAEEKARAVLAACSISRKRPPKSLRTTSAYGSSRFTISNVVKANQLLTFIQIFLVFLETLQVARRPKLKSWNSSTF